MGRASYGTIACLLKVSRTTVYRWVRQHAEQLPEPTVPLAITEIEFDEMWHYILETDTLNRQRLQKQVAQFIGDCSSPKTSIVS
jgi:hypothetical protein